MPLSPRQVHTKKEAREYFENSKYWMKLEQVIYNILYLGALIKKLDAGLQNQIGGGSTHRHLH